MSELFWHYFVHSEKSAHGDKPGQWVKLLLLWSNKILGKLKTFVVTVFTGCLSALVYQHAITPLALPCKLLIPATGLLNHYLQSTAFILK